MEEPALVDVAQVRLAEVSQLEAARELTLDELRSRARDEHLAAVSSVTDPRGFVHGKADVAGAQNRCLAGVQSHPHPYLGTLGPVVLGHRALDVRRRDDSRTGLPENDEEGVALRVDLHPAGLGEGPAQEPVVLREKLAVTVAAEVLEQARRALDVREHEGDRASGQGGGSLSNCGNAQIRYLSSTTRDHRL